MNSKRRHFYVIDFWIPPSKPAPGSERPPMGRSGGSSIGFRASFDKKVFLGKSKRRQFHVLIFWLIPTLPLKALKSVHRLGLEAQVLTLEHMFVNSYCWE